MIEQFIARLIARYGVFPIAVALFVLLNVCLFAGIAGWNGIRANWYEAKAERIDVKARQAERAAQIAKADTKQTENSADIAVNTTKKQDATATSQRQETAQAKKVIDERIEADPDRVDSDPIIMLEVVAARYRAQAAADRVSGTPSD
jgi:hypothetical protein